MGAPKNPEFCLIFFVARFCGTDLPPDYVSNSNQLHVTFRSDYSVSHSGYRFLIFSVVIILVSNPLIPSWILLLTLRMDYDTVCGGEFTSPSGVVSSPYHPGSYPRCAHLKRDINFNSFTLDLNQDLTIKTVTLFHSYNHHHQHHLLHGIADIDGVCT